MCTKLECAEPGRYRAEVRLFKHTTHPAPFTDCGRFERSRVRAAPSYKYERQSIVPKKLRQFRSFAPKTTQEDEKTITLQYPSLGIAKYR